MADIRTAITCPHHDNCVVIIRARPADQLNGEKRIKPAMWLDYWVTRHPDRAIVEIDHNPTTPHPDVALITEAKDERDHTRLDAGIADLEERLALLVELHADLVEASSFLDKRAARLEAFVTRRKRWRKAWGGD